MMHRKDYRDAVAAALAGHDVYSGYTRVSAWVDAINAADLPAWFVATPSEKPARHSHGTSRRDTDLIVGLKRLGGDLIEDALDEDAGALEALVISTLRMASRDCELIDIQTKQDGGAEKRVGTLTLSFRVTAVLPDPAA